jgi:hypothetical protein
VCFYFINILGINKTMDNSVSYGCIVGRKRPASNTNTPRGTPAYGAIDGLPGLNMPDLYLLMPETDPSKSNQIVLSGSLDSGYLAKQEPNLISSGSKSKIPEPHQISSGLAKAILALPELPELEKQTQNIHDIPEHICSLAWDKYIGINNSSSNCYACRVKKINPTFYKCGQLEIDNITIDNLRPICLGCWFQIRKEQIGLNKYIEQYGLHK